MREAFLGADADILLWSERQAVALRRLAERHPEAGGGGRGGRAPLGPGAEPRIDLRRLYARAVREVRLLGRVGEAEPKPLAGECPISLGEWLGDGTDTDALLRRVRA